MIALIHKEQEFRGGPNACGREPVQAARLHIRLNTTIGQELPSTRSPNELVTALTHAMIGYYNLKESGGFQQDVGSRNILIIEPEYRIPLTKFEATKDLTQCHGVLTDGDLAKKYLPEGTGLRTDKEISGTLPFMSIQVLEAWAYNRVHHHTPEDDLESFFWVLVWEYLQKVHEYRVSSLREQDILETLLSSNHKDVLMGKRSFRDEVRRTTQERIGCSLLPLIQSWLTLTSGNTPFDTMFVELIKSASQELGNAVDWYSWDDFFASRSSRTEEQPDTEDE